MLLAHQTVDFQTALQLRGIDAERVGDRLYIGAYPPEGRALRDMGFGVLVLCAEELQDAGRFGRFSGVFVLHCPLDNAELTASEWDLANVTALGVASAVAGGQRCLVTCAAGRDRSGLVTALTVRQLTGWSGRRCVDVVRRARTRAPALTNPTFVSALEAL